MSSKKLPLNRRKRVSVVVLGDFGRSPRMQYHSISLRKHNFDVDVIAYEGTQPCKEIFAEKGINIHYMRNVPKFISGFPKLLQYMLKTIWQSYFLFLTLFNLPKTDCILLQNPPSIPTLPICWLVAYLRDSKLFVDFHNYGFTILGLSHGEKNLLVKFAKWCEMYFSRKADESICVTKAMQADLEQNWNIRSTVFYDCAPEIFHSLTVKEKHEFFSQMVKEYGSFQSSAAEDVTLFTRKVGREFKLLPDRPALIVSSTSWTEDEDFSILLNALEEYDQAASNRGNLPHLVVCITGKGPLKAFYEELIKQKKLTFVQIVTLWLKYEDYPKFLACADVGICLHKSSSGLDLPMKVVDMFGCCLPVCAVSFDCIGELVKDGVNGVLFSNSGQLCQQLQDLLVGFPNKETALKSFRKNLKNNSPLRWDENWTSTVLPLLRSH